jgi:hypothetical protein
VEAFADRFVRELTGRAPDLEIRSLGDLTLRLAGRDSEQRVHLDKAFTQYQKDPRAMVEILERWCAFLVAGMASAGIVSLEAVVPIVKGRQWIDQQRA